MALSDIKETSHIKKCRMACPSAHWPTGLGSNTLLQPMRFHNSLSGMLLCYDYNSELSIRLRQSTCIDYRPKWPHSIVKLKGNVHFS